MCEYHDYNNASAAMPGDQWNGLAVRISQCNAIGKPMRRESPDAGRARPYNRDNGPLRDRAAERPR